MQFLRRYIVTGLKKHSHDLFLRKCSTHMSAEHHQAGFVNKILKKCGKLDYTRAKLQSGGFLLYEKCGDGVNFEEFFKECDLPDTYFSWFRVTELHVWMCMVRAMHDGEEGRFVRNAIVKMLWQDADARIKALGEIASSQRKRDLDLLYQQFLGALFLYDEGLQSCDRILAGALWRRLLSSNCNDPRILETLVHYVRRQTLQLEAASREDILVEGNIQWLPLKSLRQSVVQQQ